MFSNIDKKVLVNSIITLAVLLLLAFVGYQYLGRPNVTVSNTVGGTNTADQSTQSAQENTQSSQPTTTFSGDSNIQFKAQGQNGGGALMVCQDKCGDGICELKPDPKVSQNCPETHEDCPQDCK